MCGGIDIDPTKEAEIAPDIPLRLAQCHGQIVAVGGCRGGIRCTGEVDTPHDIRNGCQRNQADGYWNSSELVPPPRPRARQQNDGHEVKDEEKRS